MLLTLTFFIVITFIFVAWWSSKKLESATVARLFKEQGDVEEKPVILSGFNFINSRIVKFISILFLSLFFFFTVLQWNYQYSIGFTFVLVLLIWQMGELYTLNRMARLEEQLAQSLDLMISGLQSGASAMSVLRNVIEDTPYPLKKHFIDIEGRLRLGDRANDVFMDLITEVPLESFKIFGLTMAVHWGTGGRLVPLLATVSKVIRDKIDINRQVRVQTVQSRTSVAFIVVVTYMIAYIVWRSNPFGMKMFVMSPVGAWMLTAGIVLQGLGLIWINQLTKVRY